MGSASLISSVLLMVAMVRGQMFTNRDSMSAGPERTVTTIQRTETRTMGDGTGSDVTARFGSSDPQNNMAFGGFGPTNLGSNNFMASNAAPTGNNVAIATNEVSRTSFVRMPTDAPSPTSSIVSSSSSSSSSVPLSSLSSSLSSLTSSASSPMVNRGSAMTTNTRMFDNNRNRNTVMTSNTRVSVSNGNNPRVGCVLQSIPNQVTKYRVHLFSLGSSLDFYCARGTIFYPEKCACDWPEDRNMVLPFVPTTQSPIRPFPGEVIPNGGMGSGIIRPFSTTPEPCRFRADNDRNYYQEFVPGFGWSRRRCPIGTLYREESCKCDDMAPVSSLRCTPELYVPFDVMPIEDMAGTSIPIGNNGNVDSVANAGRFDGSGRLTIWMYSNMDFGKQLTINLRFYDFPGGAEEQVLVSNCFDKELGSIEIATHPRNKEVVFRGNSNQTPGIQFTLPYQDKMWKNVTLIYDGSHLVGKVNNEERAMPMKGNLDVRFSGFEIGMCNGRGFVGYIDELTVFRCVDPMQKPTPR